MKHVKSDKQTFQWRGKTFFYTTRNIFLLSLNYNSFASYSVQFFISPQNKDRTSTAPINTVNDQQTNNCFFVKDTSRYEARKRWHKQNTTGNLCLHISIVKKLALIIGWRPCSTWSNNRICNLRNLVLCNYLLIILQRKDSNHKPNDYIGMDAHKCFN